MTDRAHVEFYDVVLKPDPSRTVVRPFEPGYPKGFVGGRTWTDETVEMIRNLDEEELERQLTGVTASLDENHRDVDATLMRRFGEMVDRIPDPENLSPEQQRPIRVGPQLLVNLDTIKRRRFLAGWRATLAQEVPKR